MTIEQFNWQSPKLDTEDALLIEAYLSVGIPLDGLAYTDEFKTVAAQVVHSKSPSQDDLRQVYRRLLSLRKRGLLPRLYTGAALSESGD